MSPVGRGSRSTHKIGSGINYYIATIAHYYWTHKVLTSCRGCDTLQIVPDFDTFFEVVFDPAMPPRNWISRKNGASCDLACLDYLREMIELCLGPAPSEWDVQLFCEDQYDEAEAFALFMLGYSVVRGSISASLKWAGTGSPALVASGRSVVVLQQQAAARKQLSIPGALPTIDLDEKDTSPLGMSTSTVKATETLWKTPVPAQEEIQKRATAEAQCYLCAYTGLFFLAPKEPKICTLCREEHLEVSC